MALNTYANQEGISRAIQNVRRARDNTWAVFGIDKIDFNVPCNPDDELILVVLDEGKGDEFRPFLTPNSACYLYINNGSYGERPIRRLSLVYWVGDQLNQDAVRSFAHVFAALDAIIRSRDTVLMTSKCQDIFTMLHETSLMRSTDSLERRRSRAETGSSTAGSLTIETQSVARPISGLHQMNISEPRNPRNLKVIIIGNAATGKTSIARFLCSGSTAGDMPARVTIGVDVFTKRILIDNMFVNLHIFDTAGQERFQALSRSYYRNVHGVVLVYSYDNDESFQALDYWFRHATQNTLDCRPAFILVGNKSDMDLNQRTVDWNNALLFSRENGIDLMETSAKTGDNINLVFTQLIQTYYSNNMNKLRPPARHTRVGTDLNQVNFDRQTNQPPQPENIIVLENPQNPQQHDISMQGRARSRQGSVGSQVSWRQKCCEE